ncbi:MAG TPA: hypothetical protein VLG37_03265 [Candidatus Saccharimonadales bacterium]|nr:hypothetical protein [Candidatus Saccharimonadales bacterium]
MKKLDIKGFSVMYAVLVIVILGIVGGAAYYVYQSNKTPSAQEKATTQSSTSKNTEQKTKFLAIKEYSIKFALTEDISDAYYHAGPAGITFSVHSLDNIAGAETCVATEPKNPSFNGEQWGLARLDFELDNPENSAFKNHANAVLVGNDYFEIVVNDQTGVCQPTDPALKARVEQLRQIFVQASKSIQKN